MKRKLKKDKNNYSPAAVKSRRKFPAGKTVMLAVIGLVQALLILFLCTVKFEPKDRIDRYSVTVTPCSDGSLDIQYDLLWTALDENEPLTWVEIGIAHPDYTVYPDAFSNTVESYAKIEEDGYIALRLNLKESYCGGEQVAFSFKINQQGLLCRNDNGSFFEFVPGWFNAIPVAEYEFFWAAEDAVFTDGTLQNGYYRWSGRLDCGGYRVLRVQYDDTAFAGVKHYPYVSFDDSSAYDELRGDRIGVTVFVIILLVALTAAIVYIVDSYVSYGRGRGFLTGHGYYVHTYGRVNPRYARARDLNRGSSRGGGGGGCACACACACAGGGRAGCSQKDTYKLTSISTQNE